MGYPTYVGDTFDMYRVGKNVLSLYYNSEDVVTLYLRPEFHKDARLEAFPINYYYQNGY